MFGDGIGPPAGQAQVPLVPPAAGDGIDAAAMEVEAAGEIEPDELPEAAGEGEPADEPQEDVLMGDEPAAEAQHVEEEPAVGAGDAEGDENLLDFEGEGEYDPEGALQQLGN